jgi:alpha-D-ribose 1-methylphosphonate 5-triphosphate synthase subunit PhnL
VTTPGPVILEAKNVTKTFTTPDGRALPVLDGVSLTLCEGEIVALLGRSRSGKSTFLRCRYGELFEYDKESGQLVLGSDPAKVRV